MEGMLVLSRDVMFDWCFSQGAEGFDVVAIYIQIFRSIFVASRPIGVSRTPASKKLRGYGRLNERKR